jgi:hypothetical protein
MAAVVSCTVRLLAADIVSPATDAKMAEAQPQAMAELVISRMLRLMIRPHAGFIELCVYVVHAGAQHGAEQLGGAQE